MFKDKSAKRQRGRLVFLIFSCLQLISGVSEGEMTVEEKVGQLLMVHFHGDKANEEADKLIREGHIGGVIYYPWANDLKDPQQVQELSDGLQELALKYHSPPLLIAVDQEGGIVNRLENGFTVFPGNYALGQTENPEYAFASALATSQELQAVGINVNFAPAIDIGTSNSVLGTRTYGNNPETVSNFGKAALQGFRKGEMITALKHFPGLGNATIDPHQGLPILNKSIEELEKWEFIPFMHLKNETDMVMTAHLLVPSLDPIHCATLSKIILDILREQMGYHGIIISDSLVMQGVIDNGGSIEEAAVKAFLAGCDILLLGGMQLLAQQSGLELTVDDILRIHRYLVGKVQSGEIPEERLNSAVERILHLKKKHDLLSKSKAHPLDDSKHELLSQEIAKQSVKVWRRQTSLPLDVKNKKVLFFAPQQTEQQILKTSFSQKNVYYFHENDDWKQAQNLASEFDIVIVLSHQAWRSSFQQKIIQSLPRNKVLIGIVLGEEEDVKLFPKEFTILVTYSPVAVSIDTAMSLIIQ